MAFMRPTSSAVVGHQMLPDKESLAQIPLFALILQPALISLLAHLLPDCRKGSMADAFKDGMAANAFGRRWLRVEEAQAPPDFLLGDVEVERRWDPDPVRDTWRGTTWEITYHF